MNSLGQAIKWIKSNRVVKHLLIYLMVIISFALLYKTVGFYYGINDDTSMLRIASGGYNGVPDGHLIYIRYALGVVIAKLFEMMPGIDWYGGMLIFFLSFCSWLVCVCIIEITSNIRKKLILRIISVLFILSLVLMNVIFFQFTTVSGMIAATVLFLLAMEREQDIRVPRILLYVVLLTVAYIIRRKVFLMVCPYVCLLVGMEMLAAINKGKSKLTIHDAKNVLREHFKRIVYYGCIIVLSLLAVVIVEKNNTNAYLSEEWSECKSYIHYRARIVDYNKLPSYDKNEALWNSMGVSSEEYAIFNTTFGILPDIDADDLQKISEITDGKTASLQNIVEKFFENVIHGGYSHYKLCLTMILLLAFFVCVNKKVCVLEKLKIIGIMAIAIAELFYLLLNGRLPNRVFFVWEVAAVAAIGGVLLRLFVRCEELEPENRKNKLLKYVLLLTICILFFNSIKVIKDKVINYKNELVVYNEYQEYLQKQNNRIFIEKNGTIESRKQFNVCRVVEDKVNVISANGWYLSLPILAEWKEEQRLNANQFPLCQKGVFYVTTDTEYIELMDKYMKTQGVISGYRTVDELQLSNGKVIYVVSWNE